MNILCICYEYPPIGGGGGPVCQGVCESLVAAGHDVDLVTSAMRGLPRSEERHGVHIHRTACIRRHRHYTSSFELLTGLVPAYRAALKLTKQKRYDLIHCHFVVPSGLVARAVARKSGLPYVITAHGSDIPNYNPDRFSLMHRLIQPTWRRILRDAAAVTTPSLFLRGLIQSQVDVPVDIIPNGFTSPPAPSVERSDRILVVTRVFERKGVQHVIEAMRGLDTHWRLSVAGDGPYLPALRTQAEQMGVNVEFLGYVQGPSLLSLYHSAKIFALPSSSENFPVVLLEAMAAGCAVITTANTGCAEVVGDAAITVEPDQPQQVRAALERLIHDENEIQRLRELALHRVEQFGWNHIGQQFEQLFLRHARPAEVNGP